MTLQTPAYINALDTVSAYVANRQFAEAERFVIALVEAALEQTDRAKRNEYAHILNGVYLHFTDYYMDYAQSHDLSIQKELEALFSEEHDNLFIAHASDIADMDDMLFEVIHSLTEQIDHSEEEARKHLDYYRRYIS